MGCFVAFVKFVMLINVIPVHIADRAEQFI